MLASIPSPSSGAIELGPLNLRMYGVMIALGVVAAVWLANKRWVARGGDPEDIGAIAVWAVPAGLIGARLYHVITDWQRFEGRWLDAFKIWEGGLGIPGGMALGILVGVIVARRRGMDVLAALDAVAPALPLAQAIGRWGNWFNQELFGGPTDLPWGLEIDPEHRPDQYLDQETFHPTFLYESLWNLGVVGLILWIDRKKVLRRGHLIGVYFVGYAVGRLWIEAMRVDPASELLGIRVNIWTMGALLVAGIVIIVKGLRPEDAPAPDEPEPDEPTEPEQDESTALPAE
ncbi:MAG: prolipoprotein diacylglyceryl transferase [Acidimicrobiales bacterium]|nr:prolipoprotein diacylglyceryl transferase [Acidimicrobiales bacterium]